MITLRLLIYRIFFDSVKYSLEMNIHVELKIYYANSGDDINLYINCVVTY